MKIEKVSENQIRCTLTREDLANRQIKLSELAYGSEKAKGLFQDMMRQADREFGFDADNLPLMIEAIPLNADCLVLIITKVEDPEELDTRFSKFAPSVHEDLEEYEEDAYSNGVPDAVVPSEEDYEASAVSTHSGVQRIFSFSSLHLAIQAVTMARFCQNGCGSMLLQLTESPYLLVLTPGNCSTEDFNRLCNIFSEYGTLYHATASYLSEHSHVILKENAMEHLLAL